MPTKALPMPPWVRTVAPDIPAGGGTTDAAQADTATPQASDRESETPGDNSSGNDDEGDLDPEPGPAADATVWKKHARTWETRAKENKKPLAVFRPSLMPKQVKLRRPRKPLLRRPNANRQPKPLPPAWNSPWNSASAGKRPKPSSTAMLKPCAPKRNSWRNAPGLGRRKAAPPPRLSRARARPAPRKKATAAGRAALWAKPKPKNKRM